MLSSAVSDKKAQILSAILFVTLGYFGFSVADLLAKILQNHYIIYQVLGMSSLSGLIITTIWLKTKHGWNAFIPHNYKLHLMRGFSVMCTGFFIVTALKTLPLADLYGIIFITPFIAMIMAVVLLKEHVGWRRWSAASVAFLGVLIIAGPQFNHIGVGILAAFLGAFFSASNIILLRKIGSGGPVALFGFYGFVFIFALSVIGLIITKDIRPIHINDIPLLLIHGPVVVFSITCLSIGYAKTPQTAIVTPFNYTQIIWGVLFGWVFFQNLPTTTTWMGLSLVIVAGLYSLWREYKLSHHS